MNANKVTLPREVAEAIAYYKSEGIDAKEIMRLITSDSGHTLYDADIDALIIYGRKNFDSVLEALVNGYEVEKSQEEKVRDYYLKIKDVSNGDDIYDAQAYAIENTLELLGIKIEGVNAE
jgi:hypothetical protein